MSNLYVSYSSSRLPGGKSDRLSRRVGGWSRSRMCARKAQLLGLRQAARWRAVVVTL